MKRLILCLGGISVLVLPLALQDQPKSKQVAVSTPAKKVIYAAGPIDPLNDPVVVEYMRQEAQAELDRKAAEAQAAEDAAQAERDRIAAEEQARRDAEQQSQRTAPPQNTPALITTGGCCGPHSDAWWHGVAICEQGGRNDPYYGYFSFMDGSAGGKSWDEQVAMGNALLARAGREIGPWAASCVAAGYNASPGG